MVVVTGSEWTAAQWKADSLPDPDSRADHPQADPEGRVESELLRAANRGDTRVARACGTSVALVRKVRERLRAYPTGPV